MKGVGRHHTEVGASIYMLPLSDPRWVENKKWRICKFFHTREDLCVIAGRKIRRNNNKGFKIEPVDDANKEALRYSEQLIMTVTVCSLSDSK